MEGIPTYSKLKIKISGRNRENWPVLTGWASAFSK
jgi:hypothetical protein